MVAIRLTRTGAKKKPSYRVIVTDSRRPRDSRSLEIVGHYNPRPDPIELVLKRERITYWMGVGAQPSNTVQRLIRNFDANGPTGPEAKVAYQPAAVEKTASEIRAEMMPAVVEEPVVEAAVVAEGGETAPEAESSAVETADASAETAAPEAAAVKVAEAPAAEAAVEEPVAETEAKPEEAAE